MPILLNKDVYRPAATPANLPFGVRSTGYYKIRPPYTSTDFTTSFVHLYWCARGNGIIEFAGRRRNLGRNQVALYYPNMRHYWYADRHNWELYWLSIDGPFAASLVTALRLEAYVYHAGPAPVALFQTLRRLVRQTSRQAELRACATAFTILTRAADSQADKTDEMMNAVVQCMHQKYDSPKLNIKTLAASLRIGRVAFFTRFRAAMGISPGAYLGRLRVQKALSLLKNTNFSIAAISRQCGYTDANYFSRVICRTTGCSPLQFRRGSSSTTCR